jgi:uncharacterized membrane protein
MVAFFANLRSTVIAGFALTALVFLIYGLAEYNNAVFWPFFVRWFHIMSGVMWIGLLWYFNFVQTPMMGKIPDELKGGVSRFIAPEALFWFRWGAMGTIVFGLLLAWLNGYLVDALLLDSTERFIALNRVLIGLGMWMGIIMWFNVWFIIWPNQKKVLNLGPSTNLTAEQKAAAARQAGMFSRINTMLSIPMLFCMASASHLA